MWPDRTPTFVISVTAYLENERVADLRSEYVNGLRIPAVGASRIHDQLGMRLIQLIDMALTDSQCRVYRPQVQVRIRGPSDERFYYPNLQVAQGTEQEHPDYVESPKLILEILSPRSQGRIRDEKVPAYQCIPSLDELVLVSHAHPLIEVRRRRVGWEPTFLCPPALLHLEGIGARLHVADIYAGLSLRD